MSQSHRRTITTPFSRHEFYDNTYLQRLRNDIQRLDNSHSSHRNRVNNIPPVTPNVISVPRSGTLRTPHHASTNNGRKQSLQSPHPAAQRKSPRPPNTPNNRNANCKTSHQRSPNRRSLYVRSPYHRSSSSRSPNPSPVTPSIHATNRNSEENRSLKNLELDNQITNASALPAISHQPSGAVRGVALSREKSNLLLRASLQKRIPFPKIGLSELPSLTVTKKPVTPQTPARHVVVPSVAGNNERLSRKDKYLYGLSGAYHTDETITTEITRRHHQVGYDRLVISPSNLSVYSARSAPDSIHSINDLTGLTIRGEKITPQCSPRGSPHISPAHSHRASPANSPQRVSYYPLTISPSHSPHRLSHAKTQQVISPSHSPHRSPSHSPTRTMPAYVLAADGRAQLSSYKGFPNHLQRRISDLSSNSLNDDVSLKNYFHYNQSPQKAGAHYSHFIETPLKYSVSPHPACHAIYTPVSMAVPLHPRGRSHDGTVSSSKHRQDVIPNGIILSPSLSRQSTNVRDMGTQTPRLKTEHILKPSSKSTAKPRKAKKYGMVELHKHRDVLPSARIADKEPSFMLERERPLQFSSNALSFSTDSDNHPNQAVIVMKTTTTVRPQQSSGVGRRGNYSRESTIHIDIAYDSNNNPPIVTSYSNGSNNTLPRTANTKDSNTGPAIPELERRPSVGTTGPIPEIRMICATPDNLNKDSPTQQIATPKSAPSTVSVTESSPTSVSSPEVGVVIPSSSAVAI